MQSRRTVLTVISSAKKLHLFVIIFSKGGFLGLKFHFNTREIVSFSSSFPPCPFLQLPRLRVVQLYAELLGRRFPRDMNDCTTRLFGRVNILVLCVTARHRKLWEPAAHKSLRSKTSTVTFKTSAEAKSSFPNDCFWNPHEVFFFLFFFFLFCVCLSEANRASWFGFLPVKRAKS